MNRRILALGALMVALALGGLLFALRRDDARSVAPHPEEAARATTHRDEARPTFAEVDPVPRPPMEAPTPSRASDPPAPPAGSATKDYVVGDVRIRDHRSGDHPAPDVAPAVHPPLGRRLPSTLTNELAQQLRAALASCATSVPAEARGAAPKIDGEIIIAIKDKQASITSATFQPRDITGDANDAVKQCLGSKAVGMVTPSGDQADVDHYAVTLSLVVP